MDHRQDPRLEAAGITSPPHQPHFTPSSPPSTPGRPNVRYTTTCTSLINLKSSIDSTPSTGRHPKRSSLSRARQAPEHRSHEARSICVQRMDMVWKRASPGIYTDTQAKRPFRSIVISVFAIVILSTIGGMFASGHHSMMGSEEDPKDGGKVAAAVFGAVVVYAVSKPIKMKLGLGYANSWEIRSVLTTSRDAPDLPPLLRLPGVHAQATKRTGRNSTALITGTSTNFGTV